MLKFIGNWKHVGRSLFKLLGCIKICTLKFKYFNFLFDTFIIGYKKI